MTCFDQRTNAVLSIRDHRQRPPGARNRSALPGGLQPTALSRRTALLRDRMPVPR